MPEEMTKEDVLNLGLILTSHKEQVAFAESECIRLKKQAESESYTLEELRKAKIELDAMMATAQEQYSTVTAQLESIRGEVNSSMELLAKAKDELAETTSCKEKALDEIAREKLAVETLKSEVENRSTEVSKKELQHEESSKAFAVKVARLQEALR